MGEHANEDLLVGHKQAGTTGGIDWLAATYPARMQHEVLWPVVGKLEYWGKGLNGYGKQWRSVLGAMLLTNGTDAMGSHLIITGDALQAVRQTGLSSQRIIELLDAYGGRFTRIDLALDFFNSQLFMRDVKNAAQSGEMETTSRGAPRSFEQLSLWERNAIGKRDELPKGHTLYFGSPKSSKMLRVYNKAVEQKLADKLKWVRFELQVRHIAAEKIAKACLQAEQIRYVVNAAMRDYCAWENPLYRQATIAGDAQIDPVGRKVTNTQAWLANQVAKAMAKAKVEADKNNTGFDPLQWVEVHYKSELRELRRRINTVD